MNAQQFFKQQKQNIMKKLSNVKNHIFQAVSCTCETSPPAAVITKWIDSWDCTAYTLSPLTHYNPNTKIAYYDGLGAVDRQRAIDICNNEYALKTHRDIKVHAFYKTIQEARKAIDDLNSEYWKERDEKNIDQD